MRYGLLITATLGVAPATPGCGRLDLSRDLATAPPDGGSQGRNGAIAAGGNRGGGAPEELGGETTQGQPDANGAGGAAATAAMEAGVGAGGTSGGEAACGALIDDLESGSGHICRGDGRIGVWYAFNDESGIEWPAPTSPGVPIEISAIAGGRSGSARAMHAYGSGFEYWGAGVGLDFCFDGVTYGHFDAAGYDGITFWARGDPTTQFRIRVSTIPTTLDQYGGTCPSEPCSPHYLERSFTWGWAQYWVPFDELLLYGSMPTGSDSFRKDQLTNLQFYVPGPEGLSYPVQNFDFWIDDVAFYSGKPVCCARRPPGCEDPLVFADPTLDASVRSWVSQPSGELHCDDFCTQGALYVEGARDLGGLQCMPNLTELGLRHAPLDDLSPLSTLTALNSLELTDDAISQLAPLSNLVGLTRLWLGQNQVTDLGPLHALTHLTELNLAENQLSTLTPLFGLPNLRTLYLAHNQVEDLTALSGLPELAFLDLGYNRVVRLGPLVGLTKLTSLMVSHNPLQNLYELAGMSALRSVDLSYDQVSDLAPLVSDAATARIAWIDLRGNPLDCAAQAEHLAALRQHGATVMVDCP
jgi:hypothetical protein